MKVIKNVLLCIAFLTVLFVGINLQHVNNEYSPAVMANVDALSTPEGEELGLGIFKADANGLVKVSGQVTCSSGGIYTCRPIECYDLYELLVVSERD